MNLFDECSEINRLLEGGKDSVARDSLIRLLDYCKKNKIPYSPCINHLIRISGLYPYLQVNTALWHDRFAFEAFKVDSGEGKPRPLHREQSDILRRLLKGDSIAVSASTSFGKTFVIDAFIAIKKPSNVMIIVPTIALMDEVRRRLYRKFGREYKIITTTDASLERRNLFVFPQERAAAYAEGLTEIDLLVVDEFYKAGAAFDKERCPSLLKAILKLSRIAKQRYFLAPNIRRVRENVFMRGMEFVNKLDFNTVFLERHDLYKSIQDDEEKGRVLVELLTENPAKTLVYAASYSGIDKVGRILQAGMPKMDRKLLNSFSKWLTRHYGAGWRLPELILHGIGVHNGQIHRSLSQIQVNLFDSKDGVDTIISTSSIVEGVNTSAEAVVLWKNRTGRGNSKLKDFAYRNIIGRAGRMFKYFVGKVYLLDKPPMEEDTQLEIDFPDSMLGGIDEMEHQESLTKEQVAKIVTFRERLTEIVGTKGFNRLYGGAGVLQSNDSDLILSIAEHISSDRDAWRGLGFLNSDQPTKWTRMLENILKFQKGMVHVIPGDASWQKKRDIFLVSVM